MADGIVAFRVYDKLFIYVQRWPNLIFFTMTDYSAHVQELIYDYADVSQNTCCGPTVQRETDTT